MTQCERLNDIEPKLTHIFAFLLQIPRRKKYDDHFGSISYEANTFKLTTRDGDDDNQPDITSFHLYNVNSPTDKIVSVK